MSSYYWVLKAILNKWVFSLDLKRPGSEIRHISAGSLFQSLGPATEKARVRMSCLRTPTGGSTFHAGDLNPGHPHERWQSYQYTIQSPDLVPEELLTRTRVEIRVSGLSGHLWMHMQVRAYGLNALTPQSHFQVHHTEQVLCL